MTTMNKCVDYDDQNGPDDHDLQGDKKGHHEIKENKKFTKSKIFQERESTLT
jgi:hypothetical protein